MKAGDKLLCKKEKHVYKNFVIDKYYTITDIYDECAYFDYDWYSFSLDKTLDKTSFNYVWDYFYTPQEVRKMKLKKLNDVKSR